MTFSSGTYAPSCTSGPDVNYGRAIDSRETAGILCDIYHLTQELLINNITTAPHLTRALFVSQLWEMHIRLSHFSSALLCLPATACPKCVLLLLPGFS